MSDKLLWKNKWLSVCEKDGWYTYVSLSGDGVSVLGYRTNGKNSIENYDFLLRKEHTPCHGTGLNLTSLTGTIEPGYSPLQTAQKELLEESGFDVQESDFTYYGWTFPFKASSNKTHLFSVCLDGKEQGEIKGDGTKGEENASVIWLDLYAASKVKAPSVQAIILQMILYQDILKK